MYLYIVDYSFNQIQSWKYLKSYLNWWKLLMCGMRNSKLSSWIFEEYLFYFFNFVSQFSSINGSRFTPIFLSWKVLFLFTKNATRNTWKCAVFLCLKEINSVQFFYLHSRQIQVLSEIGRIESWKCESEKYLFLRPHINQF